MHSNIQDTVSPPPTKPTVFTHLPVPIIPKTQPYYRSKAFVSEIGINPLIAATCPIFFLVERIQQTDTTPNLNALHQDLAHELKAFETQAHIHGYPSQTILAARYILCLWIDETILNIAWIDSEHWREKTLTDDPHHTPEKSPGTSSEKSFFSLLAHCLQDIATYIDLLELFYLCLSFGYEGEYRHTERGHMLRSGLQDNLYQRIQQYRRQHHSSHTVIASPTIIRTAKSKKAKLPLAAIAAITSLLLLSMTTIGYFLMDKHLTETVLFNIHTLYQMAEIS